MITEDIDIVLEAVVKAQRILRAREGREGPTLTALDAVLEDAAVQRALDRLGASPLVPDAEPRSPLMEWLLQREQ